MCLRDENEVNLMLKSSMNLLFIHCLKAFSCNNSGMITISVEQHIFNEKCFSKRKNSQIFFKMFVNLMFIKCKCSLIKKIDILCC